MAAPSKNFQDPTGLSRLGPMAKQPAQMQVQMPFGTQLALQPWTSNKWSITQVENLAPLKVAQPYQPRIPIPPMGRQIILTFPPIYKEKGASSTRPTVGQTWPRLAKSGE